MTKTFETETQKFRLGIHHACEESPYGYLRFFAALGAMMRQDPRLEIVLPRQFPPNSGDLVVNTFLSHIDGLLMVNPCSDGELELLAVARRLGIRVWVDWGDDILNVRPSNPAEPHFFDTDTIRKFIQRLIEFADVATVATDTMKRTFPCSDRLMVMGDEVREPISELPRRKIITWRGMTSHEEDIDSVLPQLEAVFSDPNFAEWSIALFGAPPWKMIERLSIAAGEDCKLVRQGQGKRIIAVPFRPTVLHFYDAWTKFAPYLHIVPLVDNAFNRAKTANAWFECVSIGAAVIAPDYLSEWDMPGIIKYAAGGNQIAVPASNGRDNFADTLKLAMLRFHEGKFHPCVGAMRSAALPSMTMERNNQKRWAILRKLAVNTVLAGQATEAHACRCGTPEPAVVVV